MNYKAMSRDQLIERLRKLEATAVERTHAHQATESLRHDLEVQQVELETQNQELREAQHALEVSRDRYLELYDLAPVPYLNMDGAGTVQTANRAALELLGCRIIGLHFGDLLELESATAFREHLERCRKSGARHAVELRCDIAPDRRMPVRMTTVFNPVAACCDQAFLCTLLDLTEQKKLQEIERDQGRELERVVAERTAALLDANAEMELFTASVAHDLRAPLRAMYIFAEAVIEQSAEQLDVDSRDLLRRIVGSAQRMDNLLRDLLAYSRISRTELHLRPIEMHALAMQVFESQQVGRERIRWEWSVDGPDGWVLAHAAVLEQTITNLVENARKFVVPGRTPIVTVRIEPREQTIRLWVEDNGIGIKPDYQERIFSLFERVHGNDYSGTGVGLAIVKRAVTRMGGTIGVESREGEGSRFWIELPSARLSYGPEGGSARREPAEADWHTGRSG